MDARTEHEILESIDRERARRSVILVTHRIAAAARCDQILVLDEGRVVERGTHAQLLERGGWYATVAEQQRLQNEVQRWGDDVLVPIGEEQPA